MKINLEKNTSYKKITFYALNDNYRVALGNFVFIG